MLTHVSHHDEFTPIFTSVTFPMSSTQDTTDLDLRYYGTNLRWVSMLFTHYQVHQIWVRAGQEVPRPEQWRALQGAPDLLQLEPNLEFGGEFQQDLDSRRWSSCLCLGSMYESSRGCVPQIVIQTIIFFLFSASSRIQPQVQLVGSSSWVLWKRELHLRWSRVPFWSGLRPTCLARSSLPLQRLLATLGALAFLS